MFNFLSRTVVLLCILCVSCLDIDCYQEINSLSESLKLLGNLPKHASLLFLDIDDIFLCPNQSLGRIEWVSAFRDHMLCFGVDPCNVDAIKRSFWDKVLVSSKFSTCCDSLVDEFEKVSGLGIHVVGLSKRSSHLCGFTVDSLLEIGVDFSSKVPGFLKFCLFIPPSNPVALMYRGVLFVGDSEISDTIQALVKTTMMPLKHIACISNKSALLEEVSEACFNLSIGSIAFKYNAPERFAFSWDASLIQLSQMSRIMSDKQALESGIKVDDIAIVNQCSG